MTVTTVHVRENHVGDAVQTVFPYTFYVPDLQNFVVFVDDNQVLSGFTVDGIGDPNGGNVTFDIAPNDGLKVTFIRTLIADQKIDWNPYGPFRSNTTEDAMDKITMLVQQVQDGFDRSVILPASEAPVLTKGLQYEQGGYLGWDQQNRRVTNWVCNCENQEDQKGRMYGRINADGTIVKGSGDFTVTVNGTGNHTINFNTPIVEEYVPIIGQAAGSGPPGWGATVYLGSSTLNGFTVATQDDESGAVTSRDWSFILRYRKESLSIDVPVPNGGFEKGDLTDWDIDLGFPVVKTQSFAGNFPYEGQYLLDSEENQDTTARVKSANRISFVAAGVPLEAIQAGSVIFTIAWYQARNYAGNDPGRVGYRLYDDTGTQIGSTIWSPSIDVPAWTRRELANQVLPTNAVEILLFVESSSNIGGAASAYFDYITITAKTGQ